MDQLQLPNGVTELEEWLDRSGGRTGRTIGVRRARWEDWSVIHSLATGPHAPFQAGLSHLSRIADNQFELRRAPDARPEGALFAAMVFFDDLEDPELLLEAVFDLADIALTWKEAFGLRRWLAIDLDLTESDIDARDFLDALATDPRLPELAWFEYCAILLGSGAQATVDDGVLRPTALSL